MKRKFLAALLALVMVFSMIPVSASAADDNVIYAGEDNGINITLNHRAGAVGSTEVSFTVVVDGETVVNSQSFTSTTTLAYINISANNYDVDIETEGMSCTAGLNGNYNLGFGISNTHSCTIKLTAAKTKDDIPIQSKETTYGTFSWSKQHAGNCDFERTVDIYVNDKFAYSQTVKTPNQLSNIMGVNKQFWFTPAEGYKDAYSMNREVLDTAANRNLEIYLITVCECGLDTCVCDGGCSCQKGCNCDACTGATLKDNQINTGYGLLEYSEATGKGYNLTVVINVNGEDKFTSKQLRISCGLPGNLKFTPTEGEYYLQDPNSYDLDTLRSGSTWIPGTGQLSIVGVTDEVRNYDNKLTIYLVSFENNVSLDVERRVTIDDSISGYRISYTMDGVDYSFDWYNFNASQTPSIPTNVPVTVTAICDSPYEVAQWSTGNVYGGNVTLEGSEGQNNTEAYGNTVTLTVNSVGDPRILLYMDKLSTVTVPSEDDLIDNPEQGENDVNIIGANAVKIHCANEKAAHVKDATYGLEKGTFTIGTLEGNSADGYTCDITITKPEIYVQKYNDSYQGHELLAGQGTKSFTLKWVNGEWTVPTNEIPVTYNVACTTEPGGGDENKPKEPTSDVFKDLISVLCVDNIHESKKYGLLDNGFKFPDEGVVKTGDTYSYTVTIYPDVYADTYSDEIGIAHSLISDRGLSITATYDMDKEQWNTPSPVTIEVECDSGTTEPEKPDEDAVIKLLGNEAVLVQCDVADSGHAPRNYPLLSDTFAIGNVENNTVKVTVDSEKYLTDYNLYSGKEHSEVIAQDENYFTLTWNGKDWTVSGNPVTFTVHCSASEEPEEPTAPDVAKILGTNAVEVLCVTNNGIHGSKTYGLLNGGYMEQGPDRITGQGEEDGYWQYVVTIDAGVYQAQFNTDTKSKHDLASPAETYLPITLIYRDNTWVIEGTEPYATIELVCDSEEPTLPEKPDDETIYDIFNGNKPVVLACVTENSGHEEQAFDLIPGTYEIGEVKEIGGRYLCDITIVNEQDYIDIYNTETGKEHSLSSANQSQKLTLKYVNCEWAIDDDGTVYYTVACEDTSTEPTPNPTPTPDPDPHPTPIPTPDPGDDDKPPYIPPVDPDDSGVSDLLNTDDHIQYLFGYPEGTFGPENNMTRAEVAQMFYNLLLDQDVTITKTFDDVPANAWYAKAVNTLASLGVVSGVGNGDFEPERSITRAEFTSIAMKFAEGKTGGTNIFSDVKSTDWFYRAVVNSTQYGWIHGYGDGTFRPNNPITRVEVTAIVNNMLGREADVDFVTEHYDELNHFSDLVVSHWGYYHIVEATNDHDYTKPSSGENWTELN